MKNVELPLYNGADINVESQLYGTYLRRAATVQNEAPKIRSSELEQVLVSQASSRKQVGLRYQPAHRELPLAGQLGR